MRTTVTLDSSALDKLLKATHLKTKAKAVSFAIEQALRIKEIEKLEGYRGTVTIDRQVLRSRHFAR
jgi:Arc/MetJ family transcription regulator